MKSYIFRERAMSGDAWPEADIKIICLIIWRTKNAAQSDF